VLLCCPPSSSQQLSVISALLGQATKDNIIALLVYIGTRIDIILLSLSLSLSLSLFLSLSVSPVIEIITLKSIP
jgi:hypothetical protein